MRVKVFDVQSPSALFERGGPLEGFDRASIKPADITSDRARRLREALGVEDDAGCVLGRLPNSAWAMLLYDNLHRIAVEVDE